MNVVKLPRTAFADAHSPLWRSISGAWLCPARSWSRLEVVYIRGAHQATGDWLNARNKLWLL